MGLAMQSTPPAGTGYTTLEFKISFVRAMSETSGVVRTVGRVLKRRAPRPHRATAHHRLKKPVECACDDHVPCWGFQA